jgi:hypothetical protein
LGYRNRDEEGHRVQTIQTPDGSVIVFWFTPEWPLAFMQLPKKKQGEGPLHTRRMLTAAYRWLTKIYPGSEKATCLLCDATWHPEPGYVPHMISVLDFASDYDIGAVREACSQRPDRTAVLPRKGFTRITRH